MAEDLVAARSTTFLEADLVVPDIATSTKTGLVVDLVVLDISL
jgi:hypothetical protein